MQITIKLEDDVARSTEYFLQRRYKSKAKLERLAKIAILRESANQARIELNYKEKNETRIKGILPNNC
jgi:uncharacterized protein (DUF2336 family)